ncbi:MAG: hypothetical protein HQK70_07880 [Desulfamplus sp.]|nr:hypothetical protein [Desulfamplus sp.]
MVNIEERQLTISTGANKFIKNLPDEQREKIRTAIELLIQNNTESLDIKRLLPYPKEFRLRVGDIRVLFKSDKEMLFIFKAGYRKDVYK